jgi:spore coat polysaccharide biosynthesis protein SpsF
VTKPYTVTAVIQARMGSSRLPGKVLRPLAGRPVLSWVVRAAEASGSVDQVVVATSTANEDDEVVKLCAELGVPCVRGPEEDVLSRFLVTLDEYPADAVVRLTSDCPLLDPAVIAQTVNAFRAGAGHMDYLSTTIVRCLPRGLDVEVASADALRKVSKHATGYDRVHVTSALYNNPHRYRIAGLLFVPHAEDLRITLDTPEDANLLDALVEEIGDRPPAWRVLVAMLRTRPDLVELNASVQQKALHEG